ncbi:MAG: recombinase, partial [Prevotella sp.]|nr:recombinase [Prevotella sp.]
KERVMWSAKFGKNGNEYKAILHAMHTSLYETVSRKYGLERGDSVEGRNIRHLDKHEFYREQLKLEKAIKGLTTMKENLESAIARLQDEIQTVRCRISDRKITLHEADSKVHRLENEISSLQEKLLDKTGKLQEKQQELNRLMKDVGNVRQIITPFKNHRIGFTAPQITEVPPTFGREKWVGKQNKRIETEFDKAVAEVERLYMAEAERQVKAAGQNLLVDYKELHLYRNENGQLRQYIRDIAEENGKLNETLCGLLDVLAIPDFREKFFAITDALIGGHPIPVSSGGGGDTSDLRWDGRNPDEDEQNYRRRCMISAAGIVKSENKTRGFRR